MSFSELIKNFDKTRSYMRDFYIYGFKARSDFAAKSSRTYDDEKRRIESWLAPFVRWETDKRGKRVFISLDTTNIGTNPLYNAWKAKSFTDNDIALHFAILSALRGRNMNISELTDAVCEITGHTFEVQTVRLKANEYVKEGILSKEKLKKADYYGVSPVTFSSLPVVQEHLQNAVKFFQATAPFGFIGSTIMDGADIQNDSFVFKHHYVVHTLDDMIVFNLLCAIHEKRQVTFYQKSGRYGKDTVHSGVPLQIFMSVQTGRQYVCLYSPQTLRFYNYRLDYMVKVEMLEPFAEYDELCARLDKAKPLCWGVSFGGNNERAQELRMTLHIDEANEAYMLQRLAREGRCGIVTRLGENTFLYTAKLFDVTEMMAWVKTFIGRIITLDSDNKQVVDLFYKDMARMWDLYGGAE